MLDSDRNDRGAIRNRLLLSVETLKQPDRVVVTKALSLAEEVHDKHWRLAAKDDPRGKLPFIIHPMRVALILIEELEITHKEVLSAALVHDVVEDSSPPITTHDLEKKFGRNVALIVSIITRPAPDAAIPRQQQLETYYGRIAKSNTYSRIIKLAERLDNLRDLVHVDNADFQKEYLLQTWQIFMPIAEATDARLHASLLAACREVESVLTSAGSSPLLPR
jgi:GTP pyrophosphokinase